MSDDQPRHPASAEAAGGLTPHGGEGSAGLRPLHAEKTTTVPDDEQVGHRKDHHVPSDTLGVNPPEKAARTVSEAYAATLQAVLDHGAITPGVTDPTSVGSSFGTHPRPYLELLGHKLTIGPGALALPISPSRCPNIAFACAQLLWVLSGSDDARTIGFYNARAESFTDDDAHLAGAVGPRLGGERAYLQSIVRLLGRDSGSRRAIIPLIYPSDLLESARDFPCGLALQFFVRDEQLMATCFMRSQSALMVMPYDLFLFRGIQQVLASELGLEAGDYIHLTSSMHIYMDEEELARQVLEEPSSSLGFGAVSGGIEEVDRTIGFEQLVREAVWAHDKSTIEQLVSGERDAHAFWDQARVILLYKAATVLRLEKASDSLAGLLPAAMTATFASRVRAT